MIRHFRSVWVFHVLAVLALSSVAWASGPEVVIDPDGSLSLNGGGVFHTTDHQITNLKAIDLSDSTVVLVTWDEILDGGFAQPYYAISKDGKSVVTVRPTSYLLKLRYGDFDPLVQIPSVPESLAADGTTNLYIVQFVTQTLEEFRRDIGNLGGTVHSFLANHAHIVRMKPEVRDAVERLPYVRAVVAYHPAYRLDSSYMQVASRVDKPGTGHRCNIMVFEPSEGQKGTIAAAVRQVGGSVDREHAGKHLVEATLTLDQIYEIAHRDEVLFIDPWSPYTVDMDVVRQVGGADYIETIAGYAGQGVRGEAFDGGFNLTHGDFQSIPLIVHGEAGVASHGAATSGVCFGDGTGDINARGLLPLGQGIVSNYDGVMATPTRYDHTGELLGDPYYGVFQTSSVGSDQTPEYTSISADNDSALFDFDVVHCQSQSNLGTVNSRPQAWSKNIISVGAVNHYETADRSDDCWCGDASIGPAADGRIKPDLCGFYDGIWTTYTTGSGYDYFGGTSGATPIVAGHVGLFFQMWADETDGVNIFGNDVPVPGGTVFENRCHMTTAKAALINSAYQYEFSGTSHDLTRVHQGWGFPDLAYMWDNRESMFFLDETEVLENMESAEFIAVVDAGTPQLRVTMTYADPAGLPSSSQHRINDLSLKVTSPSEVVYWGNNGLLEGNFSTPGGSSNTIDTVENVFIENPQVGIWSIEVIASELNEDGHTETGELDADFALVVSGGVVANCSSEGRVRLNRNKYACESEATIRVLDCDLNLSDSTIETVDVVIESDSEMPGETITLIETSEATADFRAIVTLSTTDALGVLQVSPGDTVTVRYVDADDGQGGQNIVLTDDAVVDCVGPVITNVVTADIGPFDAVVTFDTDEIATGSVRYGDSCGNLTGYASQAGLGMEHTIRLTGLTENSTFFYAVDAEDEAGNPATDDNGGVCYEFSTPDVPNFFTEQFTSGIDLEGAQLFFIPDGSYDYYLGCLYDYFLELPNDPAGGTVLSLTDDDTEEVMLTGGAQVHLYGESYSSVWVCSNGHITFGVEDDAHTESLEVHFAHPRVSALFDDFNPADGGTVSYKQLADRLVVTWEDVPQYNTADDSNTFQVELFFDGTISICLLSLGASDGIVGLSQGEGLSPDFYATDLSEMSNCDARPPSASGGSFQTDVNTAGSIDLVAGDDGLPIPPGALTYIVTALPEHGTLSDPGAGAITSVPYTLVGGGNTVDYLPSYNYQGPDSLQYKANDGGVDPDGGDSNIATVLITVGGPAAVHTFPLDDDPMWTTEGLWAFGQPTGEGSHNLDPIEGYTGRNVYGYNLEGDYTHSMGEMALTTTAMDCTDVTSVELHFWRWLGVESATYDHARIDVSNDGVNWVLVWNHTGAAISDSSWNEMIYDVSAVADNQPTVFFRWIMGGTDTSVSYPGWNIDDIEVWGVVPLNQCPFDLDGSGFVGTGDINLIKANYGAVTPETEAFDLDGSGFVGTGDINLIKANYGPCP